MRAAPALLLGALTGAVLLPAATATAAPAGDPPVPAAHTKVVKAGRKVPTVPPAPRVVTVRPGDNLWKIGVSTGRTWAQLAGWNRLPDPNLILPGQRLRIPAAAYRPPQPPPTAPSPQPSPQAPRAAQTVAQAPQTPTGSYPPARTYTPSLPRASTGGGTWACIARHESGGNPATNTGNGYYGAFQDTITSWRAAGGGPGLPSDYSYGEQVAANQRIQAQQGWAAWPNTSAMCGA